MSDMTQQFLEDSLIALTIVEAVEAKDEVKAALIRDNMPPNDVVNGLTLLSTVLLYKLASTNGITPKELIAQIRQGLLENNQNQ